MRFALPSLTLLAALALTTAAHATVDFALTDTNTHDTFTFSLDPPEPWGYFSFYGYETSAIVDGYPETLPLAIAFMDRSTSEELFLTEAAAFSDNFQLNPTDGTLPVTGDPSTGLPPTMTAGTYTGNTFCLSSTTTPRIGLAPLPTLAFLQAPIISLGCNDTVNLTVTIPAATTTVTPEPSTLALLGTGALGVFGIARRRFLS